MTWFIMPKSTNLSQKSVLLRIQHEDGVRFYRYGHDLADCEKKKWNEGSSFRVSKNGTYVLQIETATGDQFCRTFTVAFLQSVPCFEGGTGTKEDPYLIKTAFQLNAIREGLGACYRLIANIDLAGKDWGLGWRPLGKLIGSVDEKGRWDGGHRMELEFSGQLDGNGYTISHINCICPQEHQVGLFGYITGTVKNCFLDHCCICGNSMVGGIAGASDGTIKCCSVHGMVSGIHAVGGITGALLGTHIYSTPVAQIDECLFYGSIEMPKPWLLNQLRNPQEVLFGKVGGISSEGGSLRTIIKNCAVHARIVHNGSVFGICGYQPYEILNCFATGEIETNGFVMGIGFASKTLEITGGLELYPQGTSGCVSAWRRIMIHDIMKRAQSDHYTCIGTVRNYLKEAGWDKNFTISETSYYIDETKIPIVENPENGRVVSESTMCEQFFEELGWDTTHIWEIDPSGTPRLRNVRYPVEPFAFL